MAAALPARTRLRLVTGLVFVTAWASRSGTLIFEHWHPAARWLPIGPQISVLYGSGGGSRHLTATCPQAPARYQPEWWSRPRAPMWPDDSDPGTEASRRRGRPGRAGGGQCTCHSASSWLPVAPSRRISRRGPPQLGVPSEVRLRSRIALRSLRRPRSTGGLCEVTGAAAYRLSAILPLRLRVPLSPFNVT